MKRFMCVIFMLFAFAIVTQAQCLVVRVVDADTFDVKCGNRKRERIRLIAMDSPDFCGKKKRQAYFEESTKKAVELLMGQTVMLQRSGRFSFNRTLARVIYDDINGDSRDYAKTMIQLGLAYLDDSDIAEFQAEHPKVLAGYRLAQENARKKKMGVWSLSEPKMPKEWRKQNCSGSNTSSPGIQFGLF